MSPSEEPITIEYKRWRHKEATYDVIVLGVQHQEGEYGWFSHVIVRGSRLSKDLRVTWPAKVFLRSFEPVGKKIKIWSRWDIIRNNRFGLRIE